MLHVYTSVIKSLLNTVSHVNTVLVDATTKELCIMAVLAQSSELNAEYIMSSLLHPEIPLQFTLKWLKSCVFHIVLQFHMQIIYPLVLTFT